LEKGWETKGCAAHITYTGEAIGKEEEKKVRILEHRG
jgi:hypothetical protein